MPEVQADTVKWEEAAPSYIDKEGKDIAHRILPPPGFERVMVPENSFAAYLRNLPLKADGAEVLLYDGTAKPGSGYHVAVVDLPIGNRDLHQCADAVIHLRAEYLFSQQRHEDIHFNFSNGFRASYSEWRKGNRIRVDGGAVSWIPTSASSTSYTSFWKYLEMVFAYAGTASLSQELQSVAFTDMQIGDVFIIGGSPGHAEIVVDMAVHQETGEKIFLLAQSYMPAQEIHVLDNLQGQNLGPWYKSDFAGELQTPSYTFYKNSLKRFLQ
ncbi:MAG: DUF4846 domain-containing protein [Saprospirales bacterium]|nr:DUF4846 domain-containing protein [Saprospirales bacterium]